MMKKTSYVLIATLLTGFALSALAAKQGLYRWYDENGQPQYADRPPVGVQSEFIESAYSGTGKEDSPSTTNTEVTAKEKTSGSFDEQPKSLEIVPPKDPAICKQAQDNLRALTGTPRVRITEADGTVRFLNEEEKEAQRERARQFIKLNCD